MPLGDDIRIRQIALEINGGCNFKCPMCPQSSGREKEFLRKLPFEVFTKIVDDGVQYGLEAVSLQGSGEPTLNRDMWRYVAYVKKKGLRCISLTNGYRLDAEMSESLIRAGIDNLRVSAVGYDRETYKKWMSRDAFERVRRQVKDFINLNDRLGGHSELSLYHLVLDPKRQDHEVAQYRRNWIDFAGARAEIWMMHNWAGTFGNIPYHRRNSERRSCGRPNAPYLYVRAGGLNGQHGAVVACCFTLGRDSEAVLGHLDRQTISEVVTGKPYDALRRRHDAERFDGIPYCKDCDQLYDCPESLIWTNIPGKEYGQSKALQDLDFRQYAS
jgi:organic radical activating enzyme